MAKRNCSIGGCIRPSRKRGWCETHYSRWRKTGVVGGDIKPAPPHGLTHYEVIVFHGCDVTPSGCWEYRGPRFAKGYAQVKAEGSNPRLGHRIVWEQFHGEIPEDLVVRHRCDNPPCINPFHLLIGTQQDNVDDRERRGRGRYSVR